MKLRLLVVLLLTGACASSQRYIPGTKVPDTGENREILRAVERYRLAVEKRDTPGLLSMASRNYWEDGGTPTGADDYGYDGLREVLATRFQRADGIRYSMRYVNVRLRPGNRATVDILVDASYSITTPAGSERKDMKDQNELVLEYDGQRWLFVSGM